MEEYVFTLLSWNGVYIIRRCGERDKQQITPFLRVGWKEICSFKSLDELWFYVNENKIKVKI